MNGNEQIVQRFYAAFQQLDYTTMQSSYSQDAEVRSMWEMLCKNARDFSLAFSNIQSLDEEYITCNWIASYTFSKTGRKVVNNIKAYMRIQDGKIAEHSDKFDFWKWSRQALGMTGSLLGWSNFIQNKVHKNARKQLEKFMTAKVVE
jgi:ketosteroid isomerase-like protein